MPRVGSEHTIDSILYTIYRPHNHHERRTHVRMRVLAAAHAICGRNLWNALGRGLVRASRVRN